MIRRGRVVTQLGAALTFLMAACGGDPDRRVMAEVDTVGGVVVVRNGAPVFGADPRNGGSSRNSGWGTSRETRTRNSRLPGTTA